MTYLPTSDDYSLPKSIGCMFAFVVIGYFVLFILPSLIVDALTYIFSQGANP